MISKGFRIEKGIIFHNLKSFFFISLKEKELLNNHPQFYPD
jgi:hypothetical protein